MVLLLLVYDILYNVVILMNDVIKVVAALTRYQDKYLIAKRIKGDEGAAGKWEYPGGKIEKEESLFDAIKREMKEEFYLDVEPIKEITKNTTEYPTRTIEVTLILCTSNTDKVKMNIRDHSDYRWVTIDELNTYDFAISDSKITKYLLDNKSILN